MKILKYAVRAGVLCAALFTTVMVNAQSVKLKVLSWNILSFEKEDKSGAEAGFPVEEYVDLVKAQNPDVVCFNEFATGPSRMGTEKPRSLPCWRCILSTSCPIRRTRAITAT